MGLKRDRQRMDDEGSVRGRVVGGKQEKKEVEMKSNKRAE